MSMLLFMPWCPIDRQYEVGKITVLPFGIHRTMSDLDATTQERISAIMATYKDIEGKPIEEAALVRYESKKLTDNLSDEEISDTYEFVTLACFLGLAKREYFDSIGSYSNSDCFSLFVQKFDSPDFTTITTRRREGRTLSGWPIDDIAITIPVHCHTIRQVSLDDDLLQALINHCAEATSSERGRWLNAISCFNMANTDSDNVRHQIEWVLLCSAFEHILSARPNAKDVASKFSQILVPSNELLADTSDRLSNQKRSIGVSIRYEWIKEFYRIRGDYAHGRLNSQQSTTWEPLEHLVLSTIAFPLVIKSLLSRANMYALTDNDHAQINCFEQMADTKDFLKPPPNQRGSLDSYWGRLVRECRKKIYFEHALDNLRNLRKANQGIVQMKDDSLTEDR